MTTRPATAVTSTELREHPEAFDRHRIRPAVPVDRPRMLEHRLEDDLGTTPEETR